ncbi:MAG: thioredoxin family protein [Chitinophagales bacterium]|nr:thioredoxin family protein [Chitinophagales bacterium]
MDNYLNHFNLIGTDKNYHSTEDYNNTDVLVIVFSCNHCPYARAYINRIHNFVSDYKNKSVKLLVINPNDASRYPADSFDNMIPMAKQLGVEGLYLYDEDQSVAKAYNAQRTPEIFVYDKDRNLKYHGAWDDNYENPESVTKKYLREAVDAILEGKDPAVRETQPIGCSIKWKEA